MVRHRPVVAAACAGAPRDTVEAEIAVHPFELNPDMGPDGEAIVEYLGKKYGRTPEQIAETQAMIRDRGASVGFAFGPRTNVYNTFDAHRLLHWAGLEGRQLPLKQALLKAYHGEGRDPSNHDVLVAVANRSGSMVRVRVRCCKAATMPTRCARPSAKTRPWALLPCLRSFSTAATW